MEQSESYKEVERRIKEIEQQISMCDFTLLECDHSGIKAQKEIEEHFAKCFNALAERKAVLLKETAQEVVKQKKAIEDSRVRLGTSFEVCKQTLKTGAMTYTMSPDTAEMMWKSIMTMPNIHVSAGVAVQFPTSLFDVIQKHGEVDGPSLLAEGNSSNDFSKAELITTLAGSGVHELKDGEGLSASFGNPWGICFNPHDHCFYIGDSGNNAIRKLTIEGVVTTFVKRNQVASPYGIVMNHKTNCFYVTTHTGHSIMKITSSGTTSLFAGNGQLGDSDGVGSDARLGCPLGIAIDQQTGNLFICDCQNHLIRKISPEGEVSTLAGSRIGFADGNGKAAKFNGLFGICFDEYSQSLLVCDHQNDRLRQVQLNGEVSTLCEIKRPTSVAVTANRTILVCTRENTLHKVTRRGSQCNVVSLAGTPRKAGRVDGRSDECRFDAPRGLTVHEPSHSCFVADFNSNAIRKISFVNSD